jgi:hypothetical protein
MESAFPLRVVRAAVFTALALALSAGGQILVTGAPLPLATVGLAGLAIVVVASVLTSRERGFLPIAALLVPLELALNATYNVSQTDCPAGHHPPPGLTSLLLCGTGPVHGAALGFIGPEASAHAAIGVLPSALSCPQLLVLLGAHLGGGLLGAAWLRLGEEAVFRALRALAASVAEAAGAIGRRLAALLAPVADADRGLARPPAPPEPWHPAPRDVLLRTSRRRGPPARPAAVPACA